jgi:hypothetical protein
MILNKKWKLSHLSRTKRVKAKEINGGPGIGRAAGADGRG